MQAALLLWDPTSPLFEEGTAEEHAHELVAECLRALDAIAVPASR